MLTSGVKQLASFSVVLHWSPNDATSVKQLPYCLKKIFFLYKNRILDIFPWPNFFQAYCTHIWLNTVGQPA